jgi:hypothetical protein
MLKELETDQAGDGISIPAGDTIDLIYNYHIHACPDDRKGYNYKKVKYFVFRKAGSIMERVYESKLQFSINPDDKDGIDRLMISTDEKIRLMNYIRERKRKPKGFKETENSAGKYRFYLLTNEIILKENFVKVQQNHCYFDSRQILLKK